MSEETLDSILYDGVDYTDVDMISERCWLYLTGTNMPELEEATVKKAAFLHEVSAAIDINRQLYAKNFATGLLKYATDQGWTRGVEKWHNYHQAKDSITDQQLIDQYIKSWGQKTK